MTGYLRNWVACVVVALLVAGFYIALHTIENERNDRHAEVCTLAQAFLEEQRIAQTPTAVPADADMVLRETIVARNKVRARSLANVEASYRKVCR